MPGAAHDPSSELPWSFVFDPVANARALADVQRRGLEAARQVVDRLLVGMTRIDGPGEPSGDDGPKGPPDLAELWAAFVYQTMSTFSGGNGNGHAAPAGSGTVECSGGPALGSVQLRATVDGKVEEGSIWLQNSSGEDTAELRVCMGELRSPEGAIVTGLSPDPAVIPSLGAGSARLVVIGGTLSGSLESSLYRGVIQVSGAPGVAITVSVEVG